MNSIKLKKQDKIVQLKRELRDRFIIKVQKAAWRKSYDQLFDINNKCAEIFDQAFIKNNENDIL